MPMSWAGTPLRKNDMRRVLAGALTALFGPPAGPATISALAAVKTLSGLSATMAPASVNAFAATATPAATQIVVDPSKTDQTFLGVGAALTDSAVYCLTTYLTKAQRTALFTEMFGTNGLSTVRLCMGSSDFSRNMSYYTYDDGGSVDPALPNFSIAQDVANQTTALALEILAISPNVRFIAAPWTPPAKLKSNTALVNGSFTVTAANMTYWANYFVKFIQAYAALGIPIYAITPQNEPNVNNNNYPCCGWAVADLVTFVKSYLGPAFATASLSTKIWMGDADWNTTPSYANAAFADATASPYVAGSAWHGYVGTPATETAVHTSYPAKEMHFTEYRTLLSQSLDAAQAQMAGDAIIGNMRNGCQSVTFWNMALDQAGSPVAPASTGRRGVVVIQNDGSGTITRTPDYYALCHIGRYVQRGAVRIASTSPAIYSTGADIETVAWLNPDGSTAVFIWNGASSDKSVALTDGRSGQTSDNFVVTARSMVTFSYPRLSAKAALAISGSGPTTATAGTAYGLTSSASGGVPAYVFSVPGSPSGVSINAGTGVITFTTAGTYSGLSILVTDQVGATASLALPTVTVAAAAGGGSTTALARDATASGTGANASSVAAALTIDPTANLLVVVLAQNVPATSSPVDLTQANTVSAGGVALTRLQKVGSTGAQAFDRQVEFWYLQSPPTGAVTVTASTPLASGGDGTQQLPNTVLTAVSYKGAASNPFGGTATSTAGNANGTSISASSTSPVGSEVLACASIRSTSTTATVGSGQTALKNGLAGTNTLGAVTAQPGTGAALTSSFSWSGSNQSALLIVPILSS